VDLTHAQLASSETARQINRDIILQLIRTRQPISRAELARISGLQRSTVSAIIEQLISELWVREGALARLPRGRRPTMVELNDELLVVAIDLHPTQAAVAVLDLNGRILSRILLPVGSAPEQTTRRLIEHIKSLMERHPEGSFQGIGVSLPGRVDPKSHHLIFAPNLHWPDFDIKNEIEKAIGLTVELDNAANACLRSEVWFGRLEGVRNAVLVTISEGIGTGILANGRLVPGEHGMAGEFGHIPLDPSGPLCSCKSHGCWETFGSCRAALNYYAEFAPRSKRLTFHELLHLGEAGDTAAVNALKKQAHYIGRGLRLITAALSPKVILVAGDVTSAWHHFKGIIEAELAAVTLAGAPPRLMATHEGDIARLRGAGAQVLQRQTDGSRSAVTQKPAPGSDHAKRIRSSRGKNRKAAARRAHRTNV
jgi:predicted NBD/HSP70 family sugar kinase